MVDNCPERMDAAAPLPPRIETAAAVECAEKKNKQKQEVFCKALQQASLYHFL